MSKKHEIAVATVKSVTDAFATIRDVLASHQKMNEVQNVLLSNLGQAVVEIQVKLEMNEEAKALAEQFAMAAAVLKFKAPEGW